MESEGKFFVIEGPDGSGKTEQLKLLKERLERERYVVATFDFPQYGRPSSFFVREYLNGVYGSWREVGPYKASIFYALDRFDAAPRIREAKARGEVVLSNRYVASNLGHQGAKLPKKERKKFFEWDTTFEFVELGIPRPDLNILLHMPAEIGFTLIEKKGEREYLRGVKKDIHEKDIEHLTAAEESYLLAAELWPNEYTVIECARGGVPLPIQEIHELIWETVKGKLIRESKLTG